MSWRRSLPQWQASAPRDSRHARLSFADAWCSGKAARRTVSCAHSRRTQTSCMEIIGLSRCRTQEWPLPLRREAFCGRTSLAEDIGAANRVALACRHSKNICDPSGISFYQGWKMVIAASTPWHSGMAPRARRQHGRPCVWKYQAPLIGAEDPLWQAASAACGELPTITAIASGTKSPISPWALAPAQCSSEPPGTRCDA